MIEMIAAISVENILGLKGENSLLWDSEIDMQFFREQTEGKIVVMGNNTFMAMNRKALPNRVNIVLSTTQKPGLFDGVYFFEDYLDVVKEFEDFTVIGGREIYELFFPLADSVIISHIGLSFDPSKDYALFNTDILDTEFYSNYQSAVVQDTDKISGLRFNLSFSKWQRRINEVH